MVGPNRGGRPSKRAKQGPRQAKAARARSAERHGANAYRGDRCQRVACEEARKMLANLLKETTTTARLARSEKRSWGADVAESIRITLEQVKTLKHEVGEQKRNELRNRRERDATIIKELRTENARLQRELDELHMDLDGDLPWKERYDKELENYRKKAAELKAIKSDLLRQRKEVERKEKAVDKALAAAAAAEREKAEAAAEREDAKRDAAAVMRKLQAVEDAASDAQEALKLARRELPLGPRCYSDDEWALLGDEAERKARSREMRFMKAFLMVRSWRLSSIATVLHKLGMLNGIVQSREGRRLFGEELRELMGVCEGVHWGVNYGLFMHLEEKCPSRQIRRLRAAAAEKYDPVLDRGMRKPLWVNPHESKDVIYVPYTVPAPTSYADEIEEYATTHGLHSNADGTAAVQDVDLLIPHVLTRDHHRGPGLEYFEEHGFEVLCQGDGARRGVKAFCQWVFKNQYLVSESSLLLFLLALGLGYKDDATGAVSVWGDQLEAMRSIDGRLWSIADPNGTSRVYKIRTTLAFTLDLCAERLFFGISNGGCLCRVHELHHGWPSQHRVKLNTIELVLEWVARCKEPTMHEQNAMAHRPQPGESVPGRCPCCPMYNGTLEERRATFEREDAKVRGSNRVTTTTTTKRHRVTGVATIGAHPCTGQHQHGCQPIPRAGGGARGSNPSCGCDQGPRAPLLVRVLVCCTGLEPNILGPG